MVFEREVSVRTHPFLASHVIGGKAVVPVVIVLEWLAHAGLHLSPGLHFVGVDQQRVYTSLALDSNSIVRIQVGANPIGRVDGIYRIATELRSGGSNGASVLHAKATICFSTTAPAPDASASKAKVNQSTNRIDDVYASTLFHGPAFHGLERIGVASDGTVIARCGGVQLPTQWMKSPVRRRWIANPLALDAGLQAFIVANFVRCGHQSLPTRVGEYRQFCTSFPLEGLSVVVKVRSYDDDHAQADIEWATSDGSVVARMQDCEMVIDRSLAQAFARNRLGPSDASMSPAHL